MFISVVLPLPFSPRMARISPERIVKLIASFGDHLAEPLGNVFQFNGVFVIHQATPP